MGTRICVFGDSISWGANDFEHGGWAQILHMDLINESRGTTYIYNSSISGDTTQGLLSRFETEIKARVADAEMYDKKVVIIFAIGTNDSMYDDKLCAHWVAPKQAKKNFKKLARLAKKYANKVIFLSLLPVDSRVDPLPWNKKLHLNLKDVQKYNDIIKEVCKETASKYVDLISKWKKLDYKKLLSDGAHPNTEGHKLLYRQIKKFLNNTKVI